jgi:hypothetical protein
MESWFEFVFWIGAILFVAWGLWPGTYRSAMRKYRERMAAQERHWARRND